MHTSTWPAAYINDAGIFTVLGGLLEAEVRIQELITLMQRDLEALRTAQLSSREFSEFDLNFSWLLDFLPIEDGLTGRSAETSL